MNATPSIFQQRVSEEKREVLSDLLAFLKLRRGRADATGARISAIGEIQASLEEIKGGLPESPENSDSNPKSTAA